MASLPTMLWEASNLSTFIENMQIDHLLHVVSPFIFGETGLIMKSHDWGGFIHMNCKIYLCFFFFFFFFFGAISSYFCVGLGQIVPLFFLYISMSSFPRWSESLYSIYLSIYDKERWRDMNENLWFLEHMCGPKNHVIFKRKHMLHSILICFLIWEVNSFFYHNHEMSEIIEKLTKKRNGVFAFYV